MDMNTGYDSRVAKGQVSSSAPKTAFPKLGSDGKKPKKKKQKGVEKKVLKTQQTDEATVAPLNRTQGTVSNVNQQKPQKYI